MSAVRLMIGESAAAFRAATRSGVFVLAFIGLTAYMLLVLANADYLQQMGAVGIPRNAPSLIHLMTPGEMFWLIFVWAWMFAQPITRDRVANLHELVLSAPLSLRALLVGRWVGVVAAACVLSTSTTLAFLLAPSLEMIGATPPGSFASPPWMAILQSHLLFTLPPALGLGALYMTVTMRTRSVGGSFAAAALLSSVWMFSMVILRGGDVDPFVATLLDPTGYGEAEHQVLSWTPEQKSSSLLALTPALLINRIIWGALPVCAFAIALVRVRRERLTLARAPARPIRDEFSRHDDIDISPWRDASRSIQSPRWGRALWVELSWQTRRALGFRGTQLAAICLGLLAVAGSFVHVVGHAEGPLVPRPHLVTPMLLEFSYIIVVFAIAGIAGAIARGDDHLGFDELLDVTPAPEWVRQLARIGAALVVTAMFSFIPALASVIVTALAAPGAVDVMFPFRDALLGVLPAMFELCALMLLAHAVVRRTGPAYALAILLAFVCIINHELGLVSYSPFELAIPAHVELSELTGFAPWRGFRLTLALHKLAITGVLLGVTALFVARGVERGWTATLRRARRRVLAGPGAVIIGSALVLSVTTIYLQHKLIDLGGYRSASAQRAEDAAWERHWLTRGGGVTVDGGRVEVEVEAGRLARGHWTMVGVRGPYLHAELPDGFALTSLRVDGVERAPELAHDHLGVALDGCMASPCAIELTWTVHTLGWSAEGEPSWNNSNGVWLRAADVVPRIGLDLTRVLRGPSDRAAHDLPEALPQLTNERVVPVRGVTASGRWTWSTRLSTGELLDEGISEAPLDFAAVWAPHAETVTAGSHTAVVGPDLVAAVPEVMEDLAAASGALARRLRPLPPVRHVIATPRGLGEPALIGDSLWLPEDAGWDAAATGVGRDLRRVAIAEALASAHIARTANLRATPAGLWFERGVARALGLLALGDTAGDEALQRVLSRETEHVILEMAASEAPVVDLASASVDGWAHAYTPLAALSWTASRSPETLDQLLTRARERGPERSISKSVLGPPRASDLTVDADGQVHGTREIWHDGGWTPASDDVSPWSPTEGRLMLDRWPSFERSPEDNLLRSAARPR